MLGLIERNLSPVYKLGIKTYHVRYKDMSMKPKRTLGPAAFEAYMNFADSLKDGTNNDSIDRFKYRFAVKEGYIRPKKAKPMTESIGGLSMGDFETAFKGLVGGFLPHLGKEDQEFLGAVCSALDEKINGGDLAGAQDVLKGAMRDAGGDPDAYEGDEFDDGEGDGEGECEDGECEDGETCPEGKTCKDGECEDAEGESDDGDDKKNMTEAAQLHPDDSCPHINTRAVGAPSKNISYDYADDADYLPPMLHDDDEVYDDGEMAELDFGHTGFYGHNRSNEFAPDMQCQQAPGKKANAAQANGEAISTVTPGFQTDDNDVELEPENGDYVDDIISRNDDMDVYGNRNEPASGHMFSDDVEDFGASPDVDYDALADMILSDNGYGNMTVANGGVGQRNRQFVNRG